jgi:hypothetical protein
MYRPLLEGKVSMTELKTCLTCYDLFEINAYMDMQNDIKLHNQELQEAQQKSRSR